MKRLLLACLAGAMLALPLAAQPGSSQVARDTQPVIFDFKKELDITPEQESQIRALLEELKKSMDAGGKRLETMELAYRSLLEKEPTLKQARAKLQEISNYTVELRLIDFQTSRRITAVLRAEQLRKWKEIQTRLRANQK